MRYNTRRTHFPSIMSTGGPRFTSGLRSGKSGRKDVKQKGCKAKQRVVKPWIFGRKAKQWGKTGIDLKAKRT